MDIQVKYYNESFVHIVCSDSTFFDMKDYFSFFVDGYKFNPKYKYGNWSGKIYLLDNKRMLPFGLTKKVKQFASDNEYTIDIDVRILEREPISETEVKDWIKQFTIYSDGKQIEPYWYQIDSIVKGIIEKKQILNLPTSAGKSLIQAMLSKYYVNNFEGKVLILVPTTALTLQMKDDFIDYGLFNESDIDILGGGKKLYNKRPIVVSTWQSAIKQEQGWLHQFGMLLVDECHLSNGASITKLTQGLVNCIYKIGLSGSLKDGKANLMQYIGLFGDIFKPVSTAELIEEGQVTKLKVNCLFFKYPEEVKKEIKGMVYQDEISYITNYSVRNNKVSALAKRLANKNENVFLMYRYTAHGEKLYEYLKQHHDKVYLVNGNVSAENRDILKKMAEKETGMIVIASYGVFSTGISIKNLHHVILAHPVKSKVTVLQTIGRILRKHDSKTEAIVWDIIDDASTMKENKKTGEKKRVNINYALTHGIDDSSYIILENITYITDGNMSQYNQTNARNFQLDIPDAELTRGFKTNIQSALVPGLRIPVTDGPGGNKGLSRSKLPGSTIEFDPLMIRFLVDEKLDSWVELYQWALSINNYLKDDDSGSAWIKGNIPEFITLNILDNSNTDIIMSINYYGAWISEIGELDFTYTDENDMAITCTATFNYKYYTIERNGIVIDSKQSIAESANSRGAGTDISGISLHPNLRK